MKPRYSAIASSTMASTAGLMAFLRFLEGTPWGWDGGAAWTFAALGLGAVAVYEWMGK